MDLNWLLIWISGVSCAVNLAFVLRNHASPAWGWRIILGGMLILLGVCWKLVPGLAGYIVGPLWLLLVLLPGLLMRRVNRRLSRQHYRRALWLARFAAWLHPFDGWPQQTHLVRALGLFERGRTDEASQLIARLGAVDSSLGRTARLIQAQQTGNWQELLDTIKRRYSPAEVIHDESLLIANLQALGELGRTEEMLLQADAVLEAPGGLSSIGRAILQMRIAALAGQVAATERQLSTLTRFYPEDVRTYWLLTARQVAGSEGADEEFRTLLQRASPYLRPMIERRLSQPLPRFDPQEQSPPTAATLTRLAASIEQDVQNAQWLDEESPTRPWATWAIALGLIVNFLREVPGGGWNPNTLRYLGNLIDLGALVIPQAPPFDQWWRVLTAGFLHFGPLHLGLNLLGLLVLAPRLERVWGRLPMIVCYLTTTFTSMALAPFIMRLSDGPPFRVLVGASGGIMGLLGGLVGLMLVGWLRHRTEHTRKPLLFLLLIIALQTTFDLNTENVAFECHLLGLLTGIAFGTGWTWWAQWRKGREFSD